MEKMYLNIIKIKRRLIHYQQSKRNQKDTSVNKKDTMKVLSNGT